MKHVLSSVLLGATLLLCAVPAAAADMVVVMHSGSAVHAIDADDVKRLFLGKSRKLPDGGKALLVRLKPLDSRFNRAALGKSDAQVRSAWSRLVFSGKAKPPKAFGSAADVVDYVASNRNAVGYIAKADLTDAVKVVHAIE